MSIFNILFLCCVSYLIGDYIGCYRANKKALALTKRLLDSIDEAEAMHAKRVEWRRQERPS